MNILRIIYLLISMIKFTLELSDPVAMQSKHTMSCIYFLNLAVGL